jgi:hypothetical protein
MNDFMNWYRENKNSDTLHLIYEQHLRDKREIDPKYKLCYKSWMLKYYDTCVNV